MGLTRTWRAKGGSRCGRGGSGRDRPIRRVTWPMSRPSCSVAASSFPGPPPSGASVGLVEHRGAVSARPGRSTTSVSVGRDRRAPRRRQPDSEPSKRSPMRSAYKPKAIPPPSPHCSGNSLSPSSSPWWQGGSMPPTPEGLPSWPWPRCRPGAARLAGSKIPTIEVDPGDCPVSHVAQRRPTCSGQTPNSHKPLPGVRGRRK